jgi:hypothetical protein
MGFANGDKRRNSLQVPFQELCGYPLWCLVLGFGSRGGTEVKSPRYVRLHNFNSVVARAGYRGKVGRLVRDGAEAWVPRRDCEDDGGLEKFG